MSLNNLELPGSVIADLFKKSLVEIPGESAMQSIVPPALEREPAPPPVIDEAPVPIQYLGKNLKKVAIVVNYKDDVFLPEAQLNFLTTVLNACQLNMGDIAIVNNAKQIVSFESLLKELEMQQLILFGNMQHLVKDTEPFVIKNFEGVSILAAPSLDILNVAGPEGKILKGNLWGCLKKLFNV